jgi:hypothetical protein
MTETVLRALVAAIVQRVQAITSDFRREFEVGLLKAAGALSERVVALETRAPTPGPPGKDGAPGRDGTDGLGFEDLTAEYDGERRLTLKAIRGEHVRILGSFRLPIPIYRFVYDPAKSYEQCDVVTFGGSHWYCNAEVPTTKPGSGSKEWTLSVKCGRDGKDGRP